FPDACVWAASPHRGSPAVDAPLDDDWLLQKLGGGFVLLGLGVDVPESLDTAGISVKGHSFSNGEISQELSDRYLGSAKTAVYLIRPDQHVAARWLDFSREEVETALKTAMGWQAQ
ncbi:MAG: FAD-dependent oxidoreductase, partial [Pseudomonadota bacterium]